MPGLIAAIFIAGCALGFAANGVASTADLSKNRAEAAAIMKMQQTHPGESWSISFVQFHLVSTKVSDSAGQTYGSSWIPCLSFPQGNPSGFLRCPPPAVWAIELKTPSKQRQALVVVEARSGEVQAVLIRSTASSKFDTLSGYCQEAFSAGAVASKLLR
jgi:hypothetical protein